MIACRGLISGQAVQKFRMFVTCFLGLEEGQRPLFSASSHRVLLPDTGGTWIHFWWGNEEHDSSALSFCLSGLLVFVVLSCFFERGSRDPQGPGSLIAKGREAFSGTFFLEGCSPSVFTFRTTTSMKLVGSLCWASPYQARQTCVCRSRLANTGVDSTTFQDTRRVGFSAREMACGDLLCPLSGLAGQALMAFPFL